MFELPKGAAREYLQVFGVAAVYVAVMPTLAGEHSVIGSSLDLAKTYTFIRRRCEIQTVFWVIDRKTARMVATLAKRRWPVLDGVVPVAGAVAGRQVAMVARQLGVRLTEHQTAMRRVADALDRVDQALDQAQATGDLGWFNRAYSAYRAGSTGRTMRYSEAQARLRRAVVRRILAGQGLSDLGGEVFEGLSTTDVPSTMKIALTA
jgi:hypothetical protein